MTRRTSLILLSKEDRSAQWLYYSHKGKDQHPDCAWFSTTGQNILETLKDAGTNSAAVPVSTNTGQTKFMTEERKKRAREKEAIQPPPSSSLVLAESRPCIPLYSLHHPRLYQSSSSFSDAPPALYSSPGALNFQKAGWSYLCPINAHLNLKTSSTKEPVTS